MPTKISLASEQEINLSSKFTTSKINIGALTASLTIKLKRPTTLDLVTVWPKASVVRVTLFAEVDGEQFKCVGQAFGGIRIDKDGNEMPEYSLKYGLPVLMVNGIAKRIGETSKTSFKGFIELELLSGVAIKTTLIVAETEEKPAPIIEVHQSVAFDAATDAQEASGDGILSLSHTNSGSTNLAAFAASGNSSSGGGKASTSITYNAVGMTEMWDITYQTFFANTGYRLANPSTGTQTITNTIAATPQEHALGVITMTGVDQTTPVGTSNTADGSSGTATVTVAGTTSDGMVVDNLYGPLAGTPTVGANQTQRNVETVGGVEFGQSTQAASDGGVMSWTFTSSTWGIGAVEFKAAAGGGSLITKNNLQLGKYPHLRM